MVVAPRSAKIRGGGRGNDCDGLRYRPALLLEGITLDGRDHSQTDFADATALYRGEINLGLWWPDSNRALASLSTGARVVPGPGCSGRGQRRRLRDRHSRSGGPERRRT